MKYYKLATIQIALSLLVIRPGAAQRSNDWVAIADVTRSTHDWIAQPTTLQRTRKRTRNRRLKVAVALSVGGARGFAHIGALIALNEAGIDVDIVTGISMGCIVGAMYATGYTPQQLDSLVRSESWDDVLQPELPWSDLPIHRKLPRTEFFSVNLATLRKLQNPGLYDGQRITNLLAKYLWPAANVTKFNTLERPLACVATNLTAASSKDAATVLDSGSLLLAVRASGSFPLMLNPVWINGNYYADGGMVRALPVSEAYNLGADVVIAIDLSRGLDSTQTFTSPTEIIGFPVRVGRFEKRKSEQERASLLISPDVLKFDVFDFSKADTLIKIGKATVDSMISDIEKVIESERRRLETKNGFEEYEDDFEFQATTPPANANRLHADSKLNVTNLRIQSGSRDSLTCETKQYVASVLAKRLPVEYDRDRWYDKQLALSGSNLFSHVALSFERNTNGHTLVATVEPHPTHRIGFGIGLNSRRVVGTMSWTLGSIRRIPQITRFDIQAGSMHRLRANQFVDLRGPIDVWNTLDIRRTPRTSRSANFASRYTVATATTRLYHSFGKSLLLSLGTMGAGGRHDLHQTTSRPSLRGRTDWEFALEGQFWYDSQDRAVYPTSGAKAWYRYSGSALNGWSLHAFDWRQSIPLSSSFSLLHEVQGQYLIRATDRDGNSGSVNHLIRSLMAPLGGVERSALTVGRFLGMERGECLGTRMQSMMIGAQYAIKPKILLLARGNIGSISNELNGRQDLETIHVGAGLTGAWISRVGPVSMTVGRSTTRDFFVDVGFGFAF